MTHHIDNRGMVREREQTSQERRATLLHIAAVDEREAAARPHQPEFAAWLLGCAERARAEAAAIDLTPAQPDLFGGVHG